MRDHSTLKKREDAYNNRDKSQGRQTQGKKPESKDMLYNSHMTFCILELGAFYYMSLYFNKIVKMKP